YAEEALRWLPETGADKIQLYADPASDAIRKQRQATVGQTASQASSQIPARILLADDNADMRQYLQGLLSENYEVVAAVDGEAALAAACEQSFDLVLTDVMMPRLDGFGLLQALRADERTRAV